MNDFKGCRNCKGEGYIYSVDSYGNQTATICPCYRHHLNKEKLIVNLNTADIPLSIIDYSIDTYIGHKSQHNINKLKLYVDKFESKFWNVHLFLYGEPGTQKTTLGQWVGRELCKKNKNVKYTYMNELSKLLQSAGFEEDSELKIKKYLECDCLIIDRTFSKDQVTLYKSGYQISFIDSFLRQRLEQFHFSTIFISNVPVREISKNNFPYDMQDLIERNTIDTQLCFEDHYSLKEYFTSIWD